MPLKIAVQMDPIERINIRGDSTFALLLEAQARGHPLGYYTPDRLAMTGGKVFAQVQPLTVRDEVGNHFMLGEAKRTELAGNLDHVHRVLLDGATRACAVARTVVDRAKQASGLN